MADFHYVLRPDGEVIGPDIEEFEEIHQGEDYAKYYVPEEIVEFIEESSEHNPKNYEPPVLEQNDIKAIAMMLTQSGELTVEVLMTYTTMIQEGMRSEAAAYAAMLSWDLDIGGVEA